MPAEPLAASGEALAHALALWHRGLSVIPIPPPRPGVPAGTPGDGKVPALAWSTYQSRRPTEAELRGWFPIGVAMNLAIITGAVSGIVAIDADSPEAMRWSVAHLPYTPWQTRTARGYHLFYAHPGVRVPNRARVETHDGRLALDVRGDHAYAIAAPSLHHSGVRYREAGDWSVPREDLPRFWPGWLQRPARAERVPARTPSRPADGDLAERARRYLAAIPPPIIGAGSDTATLYAAARLVRGFGLAAHEAEALLWDWAGGRPGWTRGWIAQKVTAAVRYGTEPVGALR